MLEVPVSVPCIAALFARFAPLVVAAVLLAGCGPIGMSQQLTGIWVGEPETAEQRAARSPSRLADVGQPDAGQPDAGQPDVGQAEEDAEATLLRTDLEAIDIRLTFDLRADGTIEMWEGDDRDAALRGAWRIVSSEASGALIEVRVKRPRSDEESDRSAGDREEIDREEIEEKRWFAIRMLDDGQAFTLVEENADRGFGALYFRRQGGGQE